MKTSQTSLNFLATLSILGMSFVNSVLLARWLGPAGRGEVAAALLWPLIIPYLGAMGMIDALVYFAARPNADTRKVLGNSLLVGMALSVLLVSVGYVALPFLLSNQRREVVVASRVLLSAVPVIIMVEFVVELLRARMLIGMYNIQRLIVPAGYLTGSVAFYFLDSLTVMNIVILQMVLFYLRLGIGVVLCRVGGVDLRVRFDRNLLKGMLAFGGKSHIGAMAARGNSQLDQALIAGMLPAAQLGLYVAAVSTTSVIQTFSTALKISILPLIAQQEDKIQQDWLLVNGFRALWTLSWVVAPLFAISLYWIVPLVYGSSFSAAVLPAAILTIGSIVFGSKDLLSTCAKAVGAPWLGSKAELVALFITMLLLLVTLPTVGILGAAATSLIAYSVSLAVVIRGLEKMRAITVRELLRVELRAIRLRWREPLRRAIATRFGEP